MRPSSALAIISQSERMRGILDRVKTIAASDGCVLLEGETGVGKELFADYIHQSSPRGSGPCVKIALSSMPQELLESELFGHERGSFTHAIQDKQGLFEVAHKGSVFLDDVDDVPAAIQTKLLRVLESGEVLRVGGARPKPIDVRVIAASKVPLKELVDRGRFRPDLFYRLNVFPVEVPPLRERTEDIPLLMEHYLRRFAGNGEISLSRPALKALVSYDWPGNIRELRNVAQRVALFADGRVDVEDLPEELRNGHVGERLVQACLRCSVDEGMTFQEVVTCLEVNLLLQALRDADGNRAKAARLLGLSASTLRDKLKKHGLD